MSEFLQKALRKKRVTLEEILKETKLTSRASAAFASGSIMEGYANELSDLDIYAITEKKLSFKTAFVASDVNIDVISMSTLRIDIEYWPLDLVTHVVEKIDKLHLEDQILLELLKPIETRFCYRIKIGVPILNRKLINHIREMIDYKKLQEWQVVRHLRSFESRVEDAVGALQSGDYEVAFFNARDALENAVDAYLTSKGFINPAKKWRYKELMRMNPPEHQIVKEFWRLETPLIKNRENIRNYVERCLGFANDLALRAQFENG